MAEKDKKPEIRFKGYTDEWVKRELGKIADTYSGGTPSVGNEEYYNGEIPFIRSADINRDSTELYITEKGLNSSSAKLVNIGDILYALYGATSGEVGRAKVNGAINQAILTIRPEDEYEAEFITQWLRKQKKLIVDTYLQGGQGNLSGAIIKKLIINFPTCKEQTKIGTFFRNLDSFITLHQRKHDKLISVKKAMLEKMFPNDSSDIPEIRFKGFTGKWIKRSLGEVLKERKILQKISDDAPILAFAAGQGVIDRSKRKSNNRDHLTLDPTNKIYLLTEYNDIVYNPSNLKYGAIDRNKHGKGVISPIYVTFITDEEPSFIEVIVKSEKFKLRALQFEEGTVVKRQSVKPENLLTLDVNISPSRDEQKKIGLFFDNLDNLITLQQHELIKLKNIKKACLKKMFV